MEFALIEYVIEQNRQHPNTASLASAAPSSHRGRRKKGKAARPMRNDIPTISLAKPPAPVSAFAPTAEAAGRVDARLCAGSRLSQWRSAPVYTAAAAAAAVPPTAAGLPVSVVVAGSGVGVGAFGKTGNAGATGAYAAEQHVRIDGSTNGTNPQYQNKLRLMSRRDLRTWRPPS